MSAAYRIGRRTTTRGLTLVELMVVIVVVAILATLAGPSFNELVERRRLANQTEAITDLLQLARSEAIKHSNTALPRQVSVTINPGANWFVGASNGNTACTGLAGANPCQLNEGGVPVTRHISNTECAGCTLAEPPAQDIITYSFRGMVEAGGGNRTIVVESPRGYRTQVSVSLIGRVAVCTTTPPVGSYPTC